MYPTCVSSKLCEFIAKCTRLACLLSFASFFYGWLLLPLIGIKWRPHNFKLRFKYLNCLEGLGSTKNTAWLENLSPKTIFATKCACYPLIWDLRISAVSPFTRINFFSFNMQTNMIIHLLYPRSISVEQDLVCTLKYCTILIQSTILSQNISPEPPNIILLILSCLKGPVFLVPLFQICSSKCL